MLQALITACVLTNLFLYISLTTGEYTIKQNTSYPPISLKHDY